MHDDRQITKPTGQLGGTITLESLDLARSGPTNRKVAGLNNRLAFTLDERVFGEHVPAYDNPEALAAWMFGFFAGRADMAKEAAHAPTPDQLAELIKNNIQPLKGGK